MNNELDDDEDKLGDLGLDDSDFSDSDGGIDRVNLPHRAGERICFVPVDKFQTMDNVASNVVPADDFSDDEYDENPQQPQYPPHITSNIIESVSAPPAISTAIDKKNKTSNLEKVWKIVMMMTMTKSPIITTITVST